METKTKTLIVFAGCLAVGVTCSVLYSNQVIKTIDDSIGLTGGWNNTKKKALTRTEMGRTAVRVGVAVAGTAMAGFTLYGLSYAVKGSQRFVTSFDPPSAGIN